MLKALESVAKADLSVTTVGVCCIHNTTTLLPLLKSIYGVQRRKGDHLNTDVLMGEDPVKKSVSPRSLSAELQHPLHNEMKSADSGSAPPTFLSGSSSNSMTFFLAGDVRSPEKVEKS